MRTSDTHDCELFCVFAVHLGVAVGSVSELEHAVAAATPWGRKE
jgi:hypothetical protein